MRKCAWCSLQQDLHYLAQASDMQRVAAVWAGEVDVVMGLSWALRTCNICAMPQMWPECISAYV